MRPQVVAITFVVSATATRAAVTHPIHVLPMRSSNHTTTTALSRPHFPPTALNLSTKPVAAVPPQFPPPPLTNNDSVSAIATEVELDHLLICALAILALYCFVALRRGRRTTDNASRSDALATSAPMAGATSDSKKTRGATRAQIESHLAHTTVTLYDGNAMGGSRPTAHAYDVQFDQQQCAICLDLLMRADEPQGKVRILRCAHAFHAGK